MHLRDRGCGNWRPELGKHLVHAQFKFRLDAGLGLFDRKGWQLVLQHAQLHGQLVAHHIRAGRQDLPELDVGRAQRRQGTGRGRHGDIALDTQPAERPDKAAQHDPHQSRCAEGVQHNLHRAGPLQRGTGADQSPDVVGSAHVRSSSRNAGPRSPCSGCGISPARTRRSAPCPETCPDQEISVWIQQDIDSCRDRSR